MIGKKRLLILIGIILSGFILFYFILIGPAKKKFNLSHSEIENKTQILRNFHTRPEGPPSKNSLRFLEREVKILEEKSREIEKAFITEKKLKTDLAPLEFANFLRETKAQLLQEAKDANAEIPSEVGFKEKVPKAEEVITLAKELEAISFIIRKGISLGKFNLKSIEYLGVKEEGPWEKVGMKLELCGGFKDIADFMYSLSHAEKVCIIKSIAIKKIGEAAKARSEKPAKPGPLKPAESVRLIEPVKPIDETPVIKKTAVDAAGVSANISLEVCSYLSGNGN